MVEKILEEKISYWKGISLVLLSFILLNLDLYSMFSVEEYQLIETIGNLFFFAGPVFAIFMALVSLIDPIVSSRISFGDLGKGLDILERKLGWESVVLATLVFSLTVNFAAFGIFYVEVEVKRIPLFFYHSSIIICFIILVQIYRTLLDGKDFSKALKDLQSRVFEQTGLDSEEIDSYVESAIEISQLDEHERARYLTALFSAQSEEFGRAGSFHAVRDVIGLRILTRIVIIVLSFIVASWVVGYFFVGLFFPSLFSEYRLVFQMLSSSFAGALLVSFSLQERRHHLRWSQEYVKQNPNLILRLSALEATYRRICPKDLEKAKQEVVYIIFNQSLYLSLALGIVFLVYSSLLFLLISFFPSSIVRTMNSVLIIIGTILFFVIIQWITRHGMRVWLSSAEKAISELDLQIKATVGFTLGEALEYLDDFSAPKTQNDS